tara:strand:- start:51039 stop:51443 length:405 start_codon:yes stop_codon:yes gene_type:complete
MSLNIEKPCIDLGIITRDAERLLAFYRDLLGLPLEGVIPMPTGGTMHRLKAGESVIKIVQLDREPAADAVPGGIPAATGYRYWTMTVSNLQEMVAECQEAGYNVVVPPKDVRPGVTIAIVADPDGNWVEFLQNA